MQADEQKPEYHYLQQTLTPLIRVHACQSVHSSPPTASLIIQVGWLAN